MTITTRRRTLFIAATLSIGGLIAAGCNSFSTSTPASLAAEPAPVGDFTGTTQPVRNFPPSVAYYQNGDTPSGSTGRRFVNGLGYNGGQTGPAGGYGYVGANNAAGGAGAASGVGGALAGASDAGFTAPNAGAAGGTGLAGTNAGVSGTAGLTGVNGVAGNTGGATGTGAGTVAGGAAAANQTAAANAAGVGATAGGAGQVGIINDRGVPTAGNTLNNANDAAAVSGRNTVSGAGASVGSGTGAGTVGGTDVTGRTGVSPEGVITSNANANTNTVGGVTVTRGAGGDAGPGSGGSATVNEPSLGQRAATAGLIASTPITGTGTFLANVVTSPYTLYEERNGIVSSGVQFPPTYTAMPALPPAPANSPVNPRDLPMTIRGQQPGIPPTTAPISAPLGGSSPTTSTIRPAVLTPVSDEMSKTAFTIAGDVQFPGRYETGTNVTIGQAVIGAGLNSAADPTKVRFRLAREGNQPAEASLDDLQNDRVQDIVLKPGDVLTITQQPQAISTVERPTTAPATGPLRATPRR